MKQVDLEQLKAHVLFCVNEREMKSSCKPLGGEELFFKMKERVKSLGLSRKLWVSRTRCLGYCNKVGAVVAVHRPHSKPQCYTEFLEADFENLWQELTKDILD